MGAQSGSDRSLGAVSIDHHVTKAPLKKKIKCYWLHTLWWVILPNKVGKGSSSKGTSGYNHVGGGGYLVFVTEILLGRETFVWVLNVQKRG